MVLNGGEAGTKLGKGVDCEVIVYGQTQIAMLQQTNKWPFNTDSVNTDLL